MALTVIQRPEEDLYVEENPTAYDVPYYTSRMNAANLPLVYKVSNTKFPLNTDDSIIAVNGAVNNGGFAQLVLDTSHNYFAKGFVKVTDTTNYNGVWKIREVVDANNIVINTPYVAAESGNVQNYYNNYSTLIKIYAGLPEYHPLKAEKPLTLITDNPITITPTLDNVATVDVSALVKSTLSLDNNYDVNDIDLFTAFYIEYSEQYDVSDGVNVTVFTETFLPDLIAGCDDSAANFVTNGDFTTNLTGWDQANAGASWSVVSSKAQVSLNNTTISSRSLSQSSLGLTPGTEYNLTFDYDFGLQLVTVEVRNNRPIFQETLTGAGSINIDFIADNGIDSIVFFYRLESSLVGDLNATLDNVSVVNTLLSPCLAYIFGVHGALQPQAKYGGNMGEYTQNFNGGVFLNKWLTLMEKPVLFKGNYFDLSTIIPQSVIQSAVQSGGFFLEVVEYDVNGLVIAENQYSITQNLGDGIYRFRLDDKTFQDKTKEFTVQILRIPVNLFVDGDQGTFDTTSDPTGNPPSDWNLEKDVKAVINFEDTIVQAGTGALKFQSRSIFDDNYALFFNDSLVTGLDVKRVDNINLGAIDYTNSFEITYEFYALPYNGANIYGQQFIIRNSVSSNGLLQVGQTATDMRLAWLRSDGGVIDRLVPLTNNAWNTVTITINFSAGFTIDVNGTSSTDSVNNTFPATFDGNIVSFGFPRSDFLGQAHGYLRNLQVTQGATTYANMKFNQEQGRFVFDTDLGEFESELINFTNEEVKFDGGAWVDVTAIN